MPSANVRRSPWVGFAMAGSRRPDGQVHLTGTFKISRSLRSCRPGVTALAHPPRHACERVDAWRRSPTRPPRTAGPRHRTSSGFVIGGGQPRPPPYWPRWRIVPMWPVGCAGLTLTATAYDLGKGNDSTDGDSGDEPSDTSVLRTLLRGDGGMNGTAARHPKPSSKDERVVFRWLSISVEAAGNALTERPRTLELFRCHGLECPPRPSTERSWVTRRSRCPA